MGRAAVFQGRAKLVGPVEPHSPLPDHLGMVPGALPHLLLVDDDLAVLRALDRALTQFGARVSIAADPDTARSIVAAGDVDALVLDYRLPLVRGDVLLAELSRTYPRLRHRTVFITGDISSEAVDRLSATGCPFLMKPFPMSELKAFVRELLASDPADGSKMYTVTPAA